MTGQTENLAVQFDNLIRRSYTTYQARIKASERLAALNRTWNMALMLSSIAVTADSVVILVDKEAFGTNGDVMLTCASIITLFASVAISGMNLSGKSRDMFTSYRRIQRLSSEAERIAQAAPTFENLERLSNEYDDMLDNSDNHSFCDYLKVEPDKRKKRWHGREDKLALVPPIFLALSSLALAAPAAIWMA